MKATADLGAAPGLIYINKKKSDIGKLLKAGGFFITNLPAEVARAAPF